MAKRAAKYGLNASLFLLMAVWALHFIYPLFYTISLSRVHSEQKEIIDHGSAKALRQLCLDRETFNKCYDPRSKELNIEGDYYDVARFEIQENRITCTVLEDKEETKLDKSIFAQLQHGQSVKNTKLACCWWPVILHYTQYKTNIFFPEIRGCQYPISNNYFLHKGFAASIVQPPRHAFIG